MEIIVLGHRRKDLDRNREPYAAHGHFASEVLGLDRRAEEEARRAEEEARRADEAEARLREALAEIERLKRGAA
jgi:hypothetical protein